MDNEFRGFGKIFAFTFKNQIKAKSFVAITVIMALLFAILPAVIMVLIELFDDIGEVATGLLETVYVTDDGEFSEVDLSVLGQSYEVLADVEFIYVGENEEEAMLRGEADPRSLILDISRNGYYELNVLLPSYSDLNTRDSDAVITALNAAFPALLMSKLDLTPDQIAALNLNISATLPSYPNGGEEIPGGDTLPEDEGMVEIVSMIITFINIMLLYFLVLSYGQSVANSLVLEKSSKLMEFFLINVKPGAIMLGKVIGIALSAIVQFVIWIISLIVGFAVGTAGVLAINPDSNMIILGIFDAASEFASMFSLPGTILGIIIIFAGFFLYCSIAAIGGALARKSEDLAATNYIFTYVLIISFFIVLYSGGNMMGYVAWHDFIPFTAVMVTPAHLMLEQTSLVVGIISLVMIALVFFLIVFIAGKIYRSMVFYKGNIPKPQELIGILKNKD